MANTWRDCSRSEFHRRVRQKYPFMTPANIEKAVARGHIHPNRTGSYSVYTEANWNELETYLLTRSRSYPRYMAKLDAQGAIV